MKKRMIGTLEVSPVGMGCMALSHGYGQIPEEAYSIEAIRRACEAGCAFFDTAEIYGAQLYYTGHNEQIVGKALEDVRGNVVLASKLFISPEEYSDGLEAAVRSHLAKTLENLRTDWLDLYYLHRVHVEVPVEAVAQVMGKLINEGLIRGWGLSQVSLETLKKAHQVTPVTAVQSLYNMLERDLEKDIFPYCLENGIGVVPFSPVASGYLSGRITADTQFEKVDDVRNWVPQLSRENIIGNQPIIDIVSRYAQAKKATNAQISIAWILHKYPNAVPIPGSKNQERILENLGAWDVELTAEEMAGLDRALDACQVYGHRGVVEAAGLVRRNRE
ncbi:MAG TPA: aldo/keto reductase [Clostridia bacterium]|jgi:aryl-alcohol dehydrogenase-like predicted oxidoreductase|nr:aldo/keto reductase [Clostridia bacterium]HPA60291.1 aldo/keto reductase [Clostridia bacterium]HPY42750.1 aldo/keto reductase [Clostridia bacterium]HQA96576.1 aldo/keto reductase [Clostridia bacterium]HQO54723.1 aldo/keto reductase [Clostridia bacterium]